MPGRWPSSCVFHGPVSTSPFFLLHGLPGVWPSACLLLTAGLLPGAWHAHVDRLPTPLLMVCQCNFSFMPMQTSDASEKDNLLRALTFATDLQVIQQTLQLALDPVVRPQDMATVVVGVAARGGVSLQQSWAFLQR